VDNSYFRPAREERRTDAVHNTEPLTARAAVGVERGFAFLDLCGFTQFTATHGEHAAIDTLHNFRALTREVVTRRGVLVDKWLGDGAMIVGDGIASTIATAAEIIGRNAGQPLALRGGVAHGNVLILDGDDYIGRPINLAARLRDAAGPGELLAIGYAAGTLAPWICVHGTRSLSLHGLGLHEVQQLGLVASLEWLGDRLASRS
jgi:adenylate cyclase